jgi:release factor glutamine methyltransferase
MKIFEALAEARRILEQQGIGNSSQDVESLLSHVLDKSRSYLIAHSREELEPQRLADFFAFVTERSQGKPLQYILGVQEFLGMDFEVTPDVLIPRPETELLVEAARSRLSAVRNPKIMDVGTGSGCIAVSLAVLLSSAHVCAVDLSLAALEVAIRNAARHHVLPRVEFLHGDLLVLTQKELEAETLDGIVSNPPYVSEKDFSGLQREVRGWEPRLALVAGKHGLTIYERLIPQAFRALRPRGYLFMEIGFNMKEKVLSLLGEGWDPIQVKTDYNQIPRVVIARKRTP